MMRQDGPTSLAIGDSLLSSDDSFGEWLMPWTSAPAIQVSVLLSPAGNKLSPQGKASSRRCLSIHG